MGLKNRQKSASPGVDARRAALDILTLVRDGKTLGLALEDCRSFGAMEGPDRAFARALASTVLRRRGSLDALIGEFIDRPLPKRSARVIDILRLSAAQTAVMGLPDHAAVSTAVDLAKAFRETEGYAALINAVARKIAKMETRAVEKLPIRSDTPGWLWRSWERAYGPTKAREIAEAHRREPPLDLTLKNGSDSEDLVRRLGGVMLPTGSIRVHQRGDVSKLDGFSEGLWWIQDAAAAIPARLVGDMRDQSVLDLCAAPGGKSMQLAAAGARVTAIDKSGPRLKQIAENLKRVGLSAQTVKADILEWSPAEPVDAVLLDAPCSATGTIRRNPDILWSRTADEVSALAAIQKRMLARAAEFVRPGGVIIYATCSLQPEEGEGVVADVLSSMTRLERDLIQPAEIGGLAEAINAKGEMRTLPSFWPGAGGMDGFFAARLRRAPA